ncbi:MAG: hypothetical protein ABIU05_01935 [Nitrospirales bacterium]
MNILNESTPTSKTHREPAPLNRLRQKKAVLEARMAPTFNLVLSRVIDRAVLSIESLGGRR